MLFDEVFLKIFLHHNLIEKARKYGLFFYAYRLQDSVFHILFQKDELKMQMGLVHPQSIC
ncbi:hypothetical protein IB024_02355 [Brucella sp. 6810]|uniref:hypothetical protein n=1 Tax=Brucella sp. 6810 TaxID=2769351 RepID=UPI00165C687F|nr:hypothetical protein [Brucella sp. 6810]QNQ62617.1 hypothetical protein IB024_02355 [Brucella sp. 6810]